MLLYSSLTMRSYTTGRLLMKEHVREPGTWLISANVLTRAYPLNDATYNHTSVEQHTGSNN